MAKQAQLDEVRPTLNKVNKGISKADKVIDAVEAGAEKVTDVVETGLETVADVIPEAVNTTVVVAAEGTRGIVHFFAKPKVLVGTVAVVSLAVGAGVSYFVTKRLAIKAAERAFQEVLDEELENTKRFYEKRATRKQPYSSPEEAAEALVTEDALVDEAVEALENYESDQQPVGVQEGDPREGSNQRTRYDKVRPRRPDGKFAPTKEGPTVPVSVEQAEAQNELNDVAAEEATRNVFAHSADIDGWDQEREEAGRDQARPYVISFDEFNENSYEHEQNTLTWYAGDEILADDRETHLEDVDGLVGEVNLKLFGHGSRDSKVVYIRNEAKEIDFEVTLNPGTYAAEVLGFEHSETPRVRKGRRGDGG